MGAILKTKPKEVRIFGGRFEVRASIEVMDSFSGHADYNEMIAHLSCQDTSKVKKLFLVHGELDNQMAFKNRLYNVGFQEIFIPVQGEGFDF